MRSNFLHLILTRYNIELYKDCENADEWMEHRFPIFTNFCLPSVLDQTCQNFIWLIFFDRNTPPAWTQKIWPLLSRPNIIPVIAQPGPSMKVIPPEVLQFAPSTIRFLVTTRLDNDDFLAANYIELMQNNLRAENTPYIMDIAKLQTIDRVTKTTRPRVFSENANRKASAFLTLVEKRRLAKTCLGYNHMKIAKQLGRYEVVDGCEAGRVFHERNRAPRKMSKGTAIAASDLTAFNINV